MKMRFFVLCCLVLCATSWISAQDEDDEGSDEGVNGAFTYVDCPFEIPEGETEGETIDCGMVIVPESRTGLSDANIELAVAILYGTVEETMPPILYLSGGPGSGGTDYVEMFTESPLREGATLIFLDQRGTGHSFPSLDCPDGDGEATSECYDSLVLEGVVLDAYRSSENAADVNDVIDALGLDRVTLYGISYGTRLALTVMNDPHPAIESVILDGVYPPNVNAYEEDIANTARVFNLVIEGCAQDADCDEAYPDLGNIFYEAVDSLNADPLTINGQEFTGDNFIEAMFQSFYDTTLIPDAPYWIYVAYNRDEEGLAEFLASSEEEEAQGPMQIVSLKQDGENDGDSEGMFSSVECADEAPFNSPDVIEGSLEGVEMPASWLENAVENSMSQITGCEEWPVAASDSDVRAATESDLPTLILNGEYDPVTPPHWGDVAAETLPNSFVYTIPGGGHGVIDMSECTLSIAIQFMEDPTAEPDASCIDDMPGPEWYIGE